MVIFKINSMPSLAYPNYVSNEYYTINFTLVDLDSVEFIQPFGSGYSGYESDEADIEYLKNFDVDFTARSAGYSRIDGCAIFSVANVKMLSRGVKIDSILN